MKIYNKVIIDIEFGETVYEDSFDYNGPLVLCGGGSDDGGDSSSTLRYAPYVESSHQAFLSGIASSVQATLDDSPFTDYTDIDIEPAFFGTGFVISSFPSLYDMYGKFMAGLDIDALYSQLFEDTVNSPEINNLVAAESSLLNDDIEATAIPRFQTGMRDMNSVISSSFVIGKSLIEDARVKAIAKFSAELKYRIIPIVTERWKTHLAWNEGVVKTYADIIKLYFSAKMDTDDVNYAFAAKNKLWPFTVYEFERAALGALQGAVTTKTDVAGASQTQKAIGGALSGAAAGMMTGNPLMGLAGGVLGLASSFL